LQQFASLEQRNQLSPQQQGHILSDIQQHQHRFNVLPNTQTQHFPPQQFGTRQLPTAVFNQQPVFSQPTQFPILLNQNQQLLQNQHLFQAALPTPVIQQPVQPLIPTVQSVVPTGQAEVNTRLVQHHTQTSFTPNYIQQNDNKPQQNNAFTPRPTVDPILAIEQQIRQLDPEKQKQRIKELREKQTIIEKHNQFVEKQYEKALKKAQADHQQFLENQREEKKKLYQRVYKGPGTAQVIRYSQSVPRHIYPEEAPLFKVALEQYYKRTPHDDHHDDDYDNHDNKTS
jgi:hypothetical protein